MLSTQTPHYLPTSRHAQHIYKVDYDMSRFIEIYSLKNNYIWNYHMPLLLPDLSHYLNHHDQRHNFQYKAITTILHKSTHYYGFTLLTMTDLTLRQRRQLNNYLRCHNLQLAAPEIDDNRLRGAPEFNSYFVTHYFSTRQAEASAQLQTSQLAAACLITTCWTTSFESLRLLRVN